MKSICTILSLFLRDTRLIGVRLALEIALERISFNSLSAEEKVRFIEGQ